MDQLYFADSESSTIRVANYAEDELSVVSGTTENDLFDYGDIDGELGENRLQHALGVVGDGADNIYIADTYNSKIKVVAAGETATQTLFGLDMPGFADGDASAAMFNEPGGLDYVDGKLYVADTNNHVIRVIDLETETVSTVEFPNPQALQINGRATVVGGNEFSGAETLSEQAVAAGDGEIVLNIMLPDGYKINDLAPSLAEYATSGAGVQLGDASEHTIEETELRVPVTLVEGEDTLLGSFDVYYCEAINETLCFIEQFAVEIPVTVSDDADDSRIVVEREIVPPADFAVSGLEG